MIVTTKRENFAIQVFDYDCKSWTTYCYCKDETEAHYRMLSGQAGDPPSHPLKRRIVRVETTTKTEVIPLP